MKSSLLEITCLFMALCTVSCLGEDNGECIQSCGELPAVTKDSPCGEDGFKYANECQMGCYNVQPADDSWVCRKRSNSECDKDHLGLTQYDPDLCYWHYCVRSEDDGKYVWESLDIGIFCFEENDCLDNQADPCDPEADPVCGKLGLFYCNTSVMECLGDEAADDPDSCQTEARKNGAACEDSEEGNYATREDKPCNLCVCESQIWRCTNYVCPGVDPFNLSR